MSNPLPSPPSNDIPGGLIKSTDVSTLYNILSGNATNSISVDGAITASDVITANGGVIVPSGQTITVPAATATGQAVNLGQSSAGLNLRNQTANRGFNISYTNTGSRTMFVTVVVTLSSQVDVYLAVDGLYVSEVSGSGSVQQSCYLFGVVPPGGTYELTQASGVSVAINGWMEWS